jgi:putative tryptophan/tyrosine transport system ATP-binding protein
MITLSNLRVTFATGTVIEKQALRGVDLKISEGEFITVIGSNGAGKSTLLNAIAGEAMPSGGHIRIDGKDVTRLPAYARADMVARVFQDPLAGSCGDLTIAENMALAHRRGQSRNLTKALHRSDREFYAQTLKSLNLGLENRLDTAMSLLSGGIFKFFEDFTAG